MKVVIITLAVLLSSVQGFAQQSVVEAVRVDVVQRGIVISGPCGAFEITSRVAWTLRDAGWGLLGGKSPAQNGCTVGPERYAVDVIQNRVTGCTIDILVNSETENRPAWQQLHCNLPSIEWRAPFEQDTPIEPPCPNCDHEPSDLAELKVQVEFMRQQMQHLEETIRLFLERPHAPYPVYRGSVLGFGVTLRPEP